MGKLFDSDFTRDTNIGSKGIRLKGQVVARTTGLTNEQHDEALSILLVSAPKLLKQLKKLSMVFEITNAELLKVEPNAALEEAKKLIGSIPNPNI